MKEFFLGLLFIQALIMLVDEFYFHHKRGLGLWEAIGHPLDTLSVIAAFSIVCFSSPTTLSKSLFVGLSVLSCLFVTKDEFVHQKLCSAEENFTHAFLFMIHPVLFISSFYLWTAPSKESFFLGLGFKEFLTIHLLILIGFMFYQFIFWNRSRLYELIKN